jgi:hypothetical protein
MHRCLHHKIKLLYAATKCSIGSYDRLSNTSLSHGGSAKCGKGERGCRMQHDANRVLPVLSAADAVDFAGLMQSGDFPRSISMHQNPSSLIVSSGSH